MAISYSTTTSLIRLASLSAKTITSRSPSSSAYRRYTIISLRTSASNSSLPPLAAAAPASPPPHFSNLPLDRAAHLRKNSSALEQLLDDSRARTIAFYDRKALVASLPSNKTLNQIGKDGGSDDKMSSSATHAALSSTFTLSFDGTESEAPDGGPPAWIPLTWHPRNSDLMESVDQNIGFIFLGLSNDSGAPVFACRLSKLTPKVEKLLEDQEDQGEVALVDVRSQGQKMTGNDAAVYALASGLFSWHANNDFCSKTGTSTNPDSAGHARRPQLKISTSTSTAGAAVGNGENPKKPRLPRAVYPRIDPAVIVAVTYHDWLLLGRKKTWDIGRYSLLAGFSEVGETLEDAVLREVVEESGVVLDKSSVQYHSSQPWPFPQSLMIGFLGEAYHSIGGGGGLQEERKTTGSGGGISTTTIGIQTSNTTTNRVSGFDVFPRGSPARNAVMDVGLKSDEIDAYATPAVLVDENEIEDARWFHREWLMEKLNLTSSASSVTTFDQTSSSLSGKNSNNNASNTSRSSIFISGSNQPVEFRIPGKYALANKLITEWLLGAAHRLLKKSQDGSGGGINDSPSSSWSGYSLPDVQIDQGVFKYILLRASNPAGTHSKLLVRGDCRAAYHNHILTACIKEAAAIDPQISITVLGGGRMEHYSPSVTAQSTENEGGGDGTSSGDGSNGSGVARIYGYSAAFGPAPHEITASVLKKADPFLDISHSYEGY